MLEVVCRRQRSEQIDLSKSRRREVASSHITWVSQDKDQSPMGHDMSRQPGILSVSGESLIVGRASFN